MDINRLQELLRQGCVDPFHAAKYHGGGKQAPPTPDYAGAARAQGAESERLATGQTFANRPTINTPWGTQSWETGTAVDPATGQPVTTWTQNLTLSPEEQAALSSQQRVTSGRSQAAETLLGQATGAFSTPFDWASLPQTPGSLDEAQQRAFETMSKMQEPGRTRQRGGLETRLANLGLTQGSEAYTRAQQDLADQFERQDQSLRAQALAEGRADVGTQQQMRQAGIAEEAQRRGMSLNELNALLTGQQVSMPQMPSFASASKGEAANLLGATQAYGNYGLQAEQIERLSDPDYGSLLKGLSSVAALAMA